MSDGILRIYDFDDTIYDGNSTRDFAWFIIKRYKRNFFLLPVFNFFHLIYKAGILEISTLIEKIYGMLIIPGDIRLEIQYFWDENYRKIKKFYLNKKSNNDIIVSASPEPLLKPIAERLGVRLIASNFDIEKKVFRGKMCMSSEKVKRLNALGIDSCGEFYTDSMLLDAPMLKFAKEGFLVNKEQITKVWTRS